MKKLQRADVGIDYVKLLADHSHRNSIASYSPAVIKEFGEELLRSLAETSAETPRIQGLRAEALFQAVIVSLGDVSLVKLEDAGDVYYRGEDLEVPDYRIVTRDGAQLLVEVKANSSPGFPPDPLALSHNYVERLRRYAALSNADLRFAVFWERTGQWTLNRLAAFSEGQSGVSKWRLSYWRAFAANEMASMGDRSILTAAPFRFRVLFDPEKSEPVPPDAMGQFNLTVRGLRLLWRDQELSGVSLEVAWKLISYGAWVELHPEYHHDADKLLWIDHPFAPPGWDETDEEHQGMIPIGVLSEMISRAYLRGAVSTIHTSAKDDILEPGYMHSFIPLNFMDLDLQLPIGMVTLVPNFDFNEATDVGSTSE